MNNNLLAALTYVELAKMELEKANKVLWLDHTLDEVEVLLNNLRDDMNNEARRLNIKTMPVRIIA